MVHSPWRENVRSDEVETHGVVGDEGEIIPSKRTQLWSELLRNPEGKS